MKSQVVEGTYGGSGVNGLRSQATEPFPLLSLRGKYTVAVEKMLNSPNGHMLAVKWVCHGCLRFILLVLPIACPQHTLTK